MKKSIKETRQYPINKNAILKCSGCGSGLRTIVSLLDSFLELAQDFKAYGQLKNEVIKKYGKNYLDVAVCFCKYNELMEKVEKTDPTLIKKRGRSL